MSRMSARFVGKEVGLSTESVYKMWYDMGLIVKNQYGDWTLTQLGREIGGRMSSGSRLQVPTFDIDMIAERMIDFWNKTHRS